MELSDRSAQHYIECEDCEGRAAKYLCKTCAWHLCEICKSKHEKRKITRYHEIKKVSEILDCSIHKTKILKFYCSLCQTPVCSKCRTESHTGHQVAGLEEVYDKMRAKLQSDKNEIEGILLPKYLDLLLKEEAKETDLSRRIGEIQKQMEIHTEKIIEKVIMLKEERICDLLKEEQKARKCIRDRRNDVERRINTLRDINNDISHNLSANRGIVFLKTIQCNKLYEMRVFPCSSDFSIGDFRPGDVDQILNKGKFGDSPKFLPKEDIKEIKRKRRETPVMCCEEYHEIEDFHRSLLLESEDKD